LEQTGELAKVGGWEMDLSTGQVHMSRQTQVIHEMDESYRPLPYSTGAEWYPPEAWPKVQAAVTAAIGGGIPYDMETPFITAKGKKLWVRLQGFPVMENGRVTRLRGTFQDITAQKLSRDHLEIYKSVLDNASDFIGIADTSMTPIYCNPAGRKMLGIPLDQDISKVSIAHCYPEDLRESLVRAILSETLSKGVWKGETEFQHFVTKERIPVSDVHFVVKDTSTNEILGHATITRDIRLEKENQKRTEEFSRKLEVERSKALHHAKLASLGEMAAGVAHEINNPLAIISSSSLLLEKYRGDPAKHSDKIRMITKAAERISKIVSGLRKFSRSPEKTDYKVEKLLTIVSEALILTESKSTRYSTPIRIEIDSHLEILCDQVEIEQVFINLINNGIDAVKAQPERWLKILAFEEGDQVVVQVIDSGSGIATEISQKLFQPFFTTKPVGEGTGLGLSISKGILANHQASLSLKPDSKNTCFEIRFPMVAPLSQRGAA
jgi:signal transduction histidine kinase